jgi:hypothetical protein
VAFRRIGNFATRRVGEETVVVPIRARAADLDSVYTLNEVGGAIWAELETPRTADEISRRVTREFEVSAEAARADVERFLATMLEAGMIEELAP